MERTYRPIRHPPPVHRQNPKGSPRFSRGGGSEEPTCASLLVEMKNHVLQLHSLSVVSRRRRTFSSPPPPQQPHPPAHLSRAHAPASPCRSRTRENHSDCHTARERARVDESTRSWRETRAGCNSADGRCQRHAQATYGDGRRFGGARGRRGVCGGMNTARVEQLIHFGALASSNSRMRVKGACTIVSAASRLLTIRN